MTEDDLRPFEAHESEVRSYCRSYPALFEKAANDLLFDTDGERYIDFLAGAGALNYGHNHPRMREALVDYIANSGVVHSLDLHTAAKAAFIDAFQRAILQPRGLDYRMMFCGPTGANAVEAALKLARKVTGRTRVAAFTNGFHGMTGNALAVTGSHAHRANSLNALTHVDRYPYDGYFGHEVDTVAMIRELLFDPSSGLSPPAAFLVETVQGEGGLRGASDRWLTDLAGLAREVGSLLIVDDIQAGCGRLGTFFSFERAGITPDVVCLSKSLSGFGLPMALVLIAPDLDRWDPGEHNGTFRGHNLAFVTATVAAELWQSDIFVKRLETKAKRFGDEVKALAGELGPGFTHRGRGFMHGIACPSPAIAQEAVTNAFRAGLIVETCGPHGEVLKCLPPLTSEDDHLDEGLAILQASLHGATTGLSASAFNGNGAATTRRAELHDGL